MVVDVSWSEKKDGVVVMVVVVRTTLTMAEGDEIGEAWWRGGGEEIGDGRIE